MDTFAELTPDDIKLATLQFMGQHLTGEVKELNRNIIGQSSTLKGVALNPVEVLKTVPSSQHVPATVVNAGINVNCNAPILTPQLQPTVINDPDQLEFDFNNCNYAKLIFERLDVIDVKITKLVDAINNK
jgi:hypothetical protein